MRDGVADLLSDSRGVDAPGTPESRGHMPRDTVRSASDESGLMSRRGVPENEKQIRYRPYIGARSLVSCMSITDT